MIDHLTETRPPGLPAPSWDALVDELSTDAEALTAAERGRPDDLAEAEPGLRAILDRDPNPINRAALVSALLRRETPSARAEALALIRSDANAGDAAAMRRMSQVLLTSDPAEAKRWLREAAEAFDTESMAFLASLELDTDSAEAERWARAAAANGSSRGSMVLGMLCLRSGDESGAQQAFHDAALAGDPAGMFHYAWSVLTSGEPGAAEEGSQWLQMAIAAGSIAAMDFVLSHGMVETTSPTPWLRWAADQGSAVAMRVLGELLAADEPTREEGELWLRKASAAARDR